MQKRIATGKERYFHIDVLRAGAILGVMLTHSFALYLGPTEMNLLWNYLHFVVVGFVLCSAYVIGRQPSTATPNRFIRWFGKRFVRLYVPFAGYLIIYEILNLVFPWAVRGQGIQHTEQYWVSSLLLTGGADVGWLTLLFIQLAAMTPVLTAIVRRINLMITCIALLALFLLATTFFRIPSEYSRTLAWIGWSFVFLIGAWYGQKEQKNLLPARFFLFLSLLLGAVFLSLHITLGAVSTPRAFVLHKYPPDLYYLSYGLGINSLFLWVIHNVRTWPKAITSGISFFSRHSYSMFFIHLILLDAIITLIKNATVWETLLLSIIGTVVSVLVGVRVQQLLVRT